MLADRYNIGFIETSAKTGENVDKTFTIMARRLKSKFNSFPVRDCEKEFGSDVHESFGLNQD
jgi:tRNA(Ser,Leu) C12 N-acetylase TAN1